MHRVNQFCELIVPSTLHGTPNVNENHFCYQTQYPRRTIVQKKKRQPQRWISRGALPLPYVSARFFICSTFLTIIALLSLKRPWNVVYRKYVDKLISKLPWYAWGLSMLCNHFFFTLTVGSSFVKTLYFLQGWFWPHTVLGTVSFRSYPQ